MASLSGADATLLRATSSYQRIEGLVDSGVATRVELDNAAQALTLIDRPEVALDARLTDASPVVDGATAMVRVKALVLTPPGGRSAAGHRDRGPFADR